MSDIRCPICRNLAFACPHSWTEIAAKRAEDERRRKEKPPAKDNDLTRSDEA